MVDLPARVVARFPSGTMEAAQENSALPMSQERFLSDLTLRTVFTTRSLAICLTPGTRQAADSSACNASHPVHPMVTERHTHYVQRTKFQGLGIKCIGPKIQTTFARLKNKQQMLYNTDFKILSDSTDSTRCL